MSSASPAMERERIRVERLWGIARLSATVGATASRREAANALCRALVGLPGLAAAAVYVPGLTDVQLIASHGFTLWPPAGLIDSLSSTGAAQLERWARGAGFGGAALIRFDAGAVVLFTAAGGEAPIEEDLLPIGGIAGSLLERAVAVEDLQRAVDRHRRARDQAVRTERLRALGDMALGVAHDFNNVLNAIVGQIAVLELRAGAHREVEEPLRQLKQAVHQGAETIDRLQDFCRQRHDRVSDPVDSAAVVKDALERLTLPQDLRIDCRLSGEATVSGDRESLLEVFDAVLRNALEAMPHGGRLSLESVRAGNDVVISVGDTGPGMSRDVRKRAFDPFFTTKGSRTAGLGLSVAYGIVRRHGGRIDIESAANEGTRVRIRLPTFSPALQRASAAAAQDAEAGKRIARILLIEDDGDNRDAMAALISLGGHEVVAAASASEGIERFSGGGFDVVVTDLGLPDLSGWEVARLVKAMAPPTPVALVTGWGVNVSKEMVAERNVDRLIKKPIDPRSFLQQLDELAGRAAGTIARYQTGP